MGSENEFCHSLNAAADVLRQRKYVDAALQRELADSFVYAMPKILFESIFWHVVKKIAKRRVYINVNFLDMFFKIKYVLSGLNMM